MSGEAQITPPSPRPSVFLSYASEDRLAARALRDTLTAAGLSPIPLTAEATDTDCLERGLRLKSKFVLTGFVRAADGQPPILTVRLYDVMLRQFIWTENYDTTTADAATVAQRLVAEVKQRTADLPKEP